MKISEIILESTTDDITADLNGLIVSTMGSGVTEIATAKLVKTLRSMGYSVSAVSILDVLENHPMIKLANTDTVQFANTDASSTTGDNDEVDKMKDRVDKRAQSAAKKEIGS